MADKPGQQLVDAINIPMRIMGALGVKKKDSDTGASGGTMNWTPKPNAEQAAEIAKSQKSAAPASAGNGHPLTPRTSQRAQNRRVGTAKEYGK